VVITTKNGSSECGEITTQGFAGGAAPTSFWVFLYIGECTTCFTALMPESSATIVPKNSVAKPCRPVHGLGQYMRECAANACASNVRIRTAPDKSQARTTLVITQQEKGN
jgi:hypothetical protein